MSDQILNIEGIVEPNEGNVIIPEEPASSQGPFDLTGKAIRFDPSFVAFDISKVDRVHFSYGITYVAVRQNPDTGATEHGAWWLNRGQFFFEGVVSDVEWDAVEADYRAWFSNRSGSVGDDVVVHYDNAVLINNKNVSGYLSSFQGGNVNVNISGTIIEKNDYETVLNNFKKWNDENGNPFVVEAEGTSYITVQKYPKDWILFKRA